MIRKVQERKFQLTISISIRGSEKFEGVQCIALNCIVLICNSLPSISCSLILGSNAGFQYLMHSTFHQP